MAPTFAPASHQHRDAVRRYYDVNTAIFRLFGGDRGTQTVHRSVWAEGITSLDAALNYTNSLVLDQVRCIDRASPALGDLGCGTGGTLMYLAPRLTSSYSAVGVTLSPVQAKRAHRNLAAAAPCATLIGDYHHLPLADASLDPTKKYELYYNYSEDLALVPPHRWLAINRGEREGVLRVHVDAPADEILTLLEGHVGLHRLQPAGQKRDGVHMPYSFPTPDEFLGFAERGLRSILRRLAPDLRHRIAGLGIAAPFDLWKWEEELGAPHHVMEAWKEFNLTAEMMKRVDWPVMPCNDASAACAAELLFGNRRRYRDFAYIYVGYFAGGGMVMNGQLHQGPTGSAAAFGSIPVPREGGGSEQLIHSASLYLLERALHAAGMAPDMMWRPGDEWAEAEPQLGPWIARAAKGLASATASIASVIDCPAVIIDGAMPPGVRHRLVEATRQEALRINTDGITPFAIEEGSIGVDARALGAASLPLFANYMADREVLFKETA